VQQVRVYGQFAIDAVGTGKAVLLCCNTLVQRVKGLVRIRGFTRSIFCRAVTIHDEKSALDGLGGWGHTKTNAKICGLREYIVAQDGTGHDYLLILVVVINNPCAPDEVAGLITKEWLALRAGVKLIVTKAPGPLSPPRPHSSGLRAR
jgi:hypothetical protein